MSEANLSFGEQLDLLFRATRQPELFRFILIQYNHYAAIEEVADALRSQYPKRPLLRLRITDENYASLLKKISTHKGLILIEDFNRLLDDPAIYVGFNQRRDRLTRLPVQLLCFLPDGPEYMRACMENIRDWWSVRNLVLHFEVAGSPTSRGGVFVEPDRVSSLGGYNATGKRKELDRLLTRIAALEANDEGGDLLLSLYPQVLEILGDLGKYKEGLEMAEHWLKEAEKEGWEEQEKANIYDRLGAFHQWLGDFKVAADYFEKALRITDEAKKKEDIATLQNNLANVYRDLGQYEKAKGLLEDALQSYLNSYGPNHPIVATCQSNLANVYRDLGQYEKSRDLLEDALQSYLNSYDPNHPIVATCQSNLANVYRNLGQYEKARDLLEDALQSELKIFGPNHPTVATRQSNLANVYRNLGLYQKAKDLLEDALESDLKNFGPNHPKIATRQSNLANVYRDLKQYEKAKELLEDALQSDSKNFGPNHPIVATARHNLGHALRGLKKYREAVVEFDQALSIFEKHLGEEHPNVGTTIHSMIDTIKEGAAAGDTKLQALLKKMNKQGGRA